MEIEGGGHSIIYSINKSILSRLIDWWGFGMVLILLIVFVEMSDRDITGFPTKSGMTKF